MLDVAVPVDVQGAPVCTEIAFSVEVPDVHLTAKALAVCRHRAEHWHQLAVKLTEQFVRESAEQVELNLDVLVLGNGPHVDPRVSPKEIGE